MVITPSKMMPLQGATSVGGSGISGVCLLAGVAMLPWTAVQVSGIPIGDLPLGVGALLLVVEMFKRRMRLYIPGPLLLGAALIALSGLASEVQPPTSSYLSTRFVLSTQLQITLGLPSRSVDNLVTMTKYGLSIFLVPVVLMLAVSLNKTFASKAAFAWSFGVAVSIAAGLSDYLGVTHFSEALIGYSPITNRQPGLSAQANNIGIQAAMAIPLVMLGFFSHTRWLRVYAIIGVAALMSGIIVSGSRGSAVGAVMAVVLMLVVSPDARRWIGRMAACLCIGVLALLLSGLGRSLLSVVRLNDVSGSAAVSDQARASALTQGLRDFSHSPLHGIGWGYSNAAHVIYVQLLAAGGMLGLLGFGVAVLGVLFPGVRLRRKDRLAASLATSVIAWLVIGSVENQLTDQWIYVPLGLLAGLVAVYNTHEGGSSARRVP